MNPKTRTFLVRILALLLVVIISVAIFSFRDRAADLANYGYPGVFVFAFLSYATLLLPAPGIAVVFSMGGVLNPIGVALAAGIGAALGELTGYLAGYSSQAITERYQTYARLVEWMKRVGPVAVFLLAAFPNPLFDLAGAAAGSLKMPYPKFLFWCWLGQTVKMLIFAFLGDRLFDLIPL